MAIHWSKIADVNLPHLCGRRWPVGFSPRSSAPEK